MKEKNLCLRPLSKIMNPHRANWVKTAISGDASNLEWSQIELISRQIRQSLMVKQTYSLTWSTTKPQVKVNEFNKIKANVKVSQL